MEPGNLSSHGLCLFLSHERVRNGSRFSRYVSASEGMLDCRERRGGLLETYLCSVDEWVLMESESGFYRCVRGYLVGIAPVI
jgi:hypothetical protein